MQKTLYYIAFLIVLSLSSEAQSNNKYVVLDAAADKINEKLIGWWRDFHECPELGNQENGSGCDACMRS